MNQKELWMAAAACVLCAAMTLAQAPNGAQAPYRVHGPNVLTPEEQQDGWKLLFDGQDLKGWHSYGQTGTGKDWSIVDGAIQLKKTNLDPHEDYADLVSDTEYTNFDLKLEWVAQPCIDSGVMFYVHESPEYKNDYNTGIEMQIADLACTVPDSRILKERSGDIFDLISDNVEWVNPAGQWNQFEIISNKGHLQLFQNGHQVIETQLWDDTWNNLVATTKFARMPGFAKYKTGRISLQGTEPKGDPGVKLWFRNIKIKEL
jgi:hypothetical protein